MLLLCLGGCAAALPLPRADAEALLTEAERLHAARELPAARDLLLQHERKNLPQNLQPRHAVLVARIQLELREPWETYLALRDFADDHPHSELRDQAIALQFAAGMALAASDAGFLIFWSDRRGARTCLEHLITRYPNCQQLPDALRMLGEMAMADRDWALAEERFQDLLRRHPDSEWAPLARFRFAMSIVGSLRGPEYDLDKMESATKELQVFLERPPENPAFVQEAQLALERLLSWRAERQLGIADFYRRVGNSTGELHHLRMSLAGDLANTQVAERARQRLQELGAPVTADGGTQ